MEGEEPGRWARGRGDDGWGLGAEVGARGQVGRGREEMKGTGGGSPAPGAVWVGPISLSSRVLAEARWSGVGVKESPRVW